MTLRYWHDGNTSKMTCSTNKTPKSWLELTVKKEQINEKRKEESNGEWKLVCAAKKKKIKKIQLLHYNKRQVISPNCWIETNKNKMQFQNKGDLS